MHRTGTPTRKNIMLEEGQVQRFVEQLQAKSKFIADRLFEEEVMQQIQQLRHRGTLRDAYERGAV